LLFHVQLVCRYGKDRSAADDDSEESDSDSEDEGAGGGAGDGGPILNVQKVMHHGAVNRVRCMPQKQGVGLYLECT
jgi:hypothetical protein